MAVATVKQDIPERLNLSILAKISHIEKLGGRLQELHRQPAPRPGRPKDLRPILDRRAVAAMKRLVARVEDGEIAVLLGREAQDDALFQVIVGEADALCGREAADLAAWVLMVGSLADHVARFRGQDPLVGRALARQFQRLTGDPEWLRAHPGLWLLYFHVADVLGLGFRGNPTAEMLERRARAWAAEYLPDFQLPGSPQVSRPPRRRRLGPDEREMQAARGVHPERKEAPCAPEA